MMDSLRDGKNIVQTRVGRLHANKSTVKTPEIITRKVHPHVFMYSMRSARSFSFLIPAKTIFVPGIYFFGLTKYSYMCLSDQIMPEFLFASEYANPSSVPDWRPKSPQ